MKSSERLSGSECGSATTGERESFWLEEEDEDVDVDVDGMLLGEQHTTATAPKQGICIKPSRGTINKPPA